MSIAVPLPEPITIQAPRGRSQLPIVELQREAVEADRRQVRLRRGSAKRAIADCSFGGIRETLEFDAWSFFHAAKKTELASSFTPEQASNRALFFANENKDLFVWDTPNLRKTDRSVFALEDFAQAGLAGRCGEATAYLTMLKWGYVFWDRIATLWERAARNAHITHDEMVRRSRIISSTVKSGRPDLEPDFVFEKHSGEVALMEAKGSFVHPVDDKPSTKDDLRHALKQLNAWSSHISPAPAKSFGIGTYFRDEADVSGDPSLIAFVDPPGESGDEQIAVELPSDWIRRGNYGAWLIGMGLSESGEALRSAREVARPERQIPIATMAGRQFAVAFDGLVLKENASPQFRPSFFRPYLWDMFDKPWRFFAREQAEYLRRIGVAGVRVLGIDASSLRLIEDVIANPFDRSLLRIGGQPTSQADSISDGFVGSVMPDNTLYGQIAVDMLADVRLETFRL